MAIIFKHFFMIFTRASIASPVHRHLEKLSTHSILLSFHLLIIHVWFNLVKVSLISLSALIEFVSLLLSMCLGCPLLALKHCRTKIKLSLDKYKSLANSKWTAQIVIHVKRALYRFAVPEVPLVFLFNIMINGSK